jgi:hypothetical protein
MNKLRANLAAQQAMKALDTDRLPTAKSERPERGYNP